MENTRFQTGLEQLSKIDGEAGQKSYRKPERHLP